MVEDYNLSVQEPTLQEDVGPDIRVQDPNPPLSPQLASKRAGMASFGLQGKIDKGYDDYYSSFIQGQEKNVRNYVVDELAKLSAARKAQKILDLSDAGWPLTEEDINNLDSAVNDPKSVIEDHFAQRYVNHILWPKGNPDKTSWLNNIHPEEVGEEATRQRDINIGTDYLARVKFFQTMYEDSVENAEKQSWTGWGVDLLKNLSTIYPWVKMHVSGTSWSDLPGNAQKEARNQMMSIPKEDMQRKYMSIYNVLKADNPSLAREFASNMVGMSTDDRTMQNILPIVAPGVEISAIAGAARAIASRNTTRTAIRQMIESTAIESGMSPEHAAALASGNMEQATGQRAWGSIVNMLRRADPIAEAERNLPNIFKRAKEQALANTGGDINGTNAIIEAYEVMERTLPGKIKSLTLPERFPALAERDPGAIAAALQVVKDTNRNISNNFWNQSNPYRHPYDRSWWSDAIIGKSSVEAFGTKGEAGKFAAEHGLNGYEIVGNKIQKVSPDIISAGKAEQIFDINKSQFIDKSTMIKVTENNGVIIAQNGSGFYLIKPFPIPEDAVAMRPFYARLPTDKVPVGGMLNAVLARFRTPNETQSAWSNRNREAATFSASVIERYAWEQLEPIRQMQPYLPVGKGADKWNDWERILNAARSEIDPHTTKIGRTYRNIGELNEAYIKALSRTPDSQEIAAYFAFKRINEMDHVLRTISVLKHKQRQGTMSFTVTIKGKTPGEVFASKEIDGVSMDHFPGGDDGIAVIDTAGNVEYKRLNALGQSYYSKVFGGRKTAAEAKESLGKIYDKAVQEGRLKIIELYSPEYYPLSGFRGIKDTDHVRYVLAPPHMLSSKPLSWDQLPERGGGHFIYKHSIRGSQLDVREETVGKQKRNILVGSNLLSTFPDMKTAEAVIGFANQARELLKKMTAQNRAAARDIVENKLNMNWDEFLGWFKSPQVRNARGQWSEGSKPRFNVNEPFRIHMANENLMDKVGENELKARYPNFLDSRTRSRNQKFMTEFSQERDANEVFSWNNTGTSDAPFYKYEPSPLLDAIPTMNRALNKIANSNAMDDMKIQAVMSWIEDAKPFLNVSDAQLTSQPLYWFHHADFIKDQANAKRINELDVARQQTKQFIGQVSIQDAVMHQWAQKISDSIYNSKFLSKYANKLDPIWIAHTLTDPTRFFRAVTFHAKMGLGSISQILVQGQTYVNILGIAGLTRATQGTFGALMHQFSRVNENPNILAAMGRYAEKFGYKPGEWEAIRQAGNSTGFLNVGKEYALRDNPMSNKVIQTKGGQLLDLGALPFTEGEKNARFGSWYTAAKEYTEKKPVSQWTNADKLEVQSRAALLNGNMNRASNAMYQRGFGALPAQFLTYTIRQMELMWGKRLTNTEKARLLLTNAMAYGLPVGLGITGLPSDFFKNAAIEAGYNPGNNYINTLITEGVPSTILALIDHDRYWNVGERLGNSGLNDFFYGDKSLWELAGGAAGSTTLNILGALDPFRRAIMSGISQDPDTEFKITYEHFLQPLKEITSFNTGERAVIAALSGNWVTKNGAIALKGIDVPEAVMSFLTGLQPTDVADLRHITDIKKAEEAVIKWAEGRAIQEAGRSLEAYDNKDPDNGKSFMTNALYYLTVYVPEHRRSEVLSRMFEHYGEVISRVRQSFGTKDVPPGFEEARRNQWIRSLSGPGINSLRK